MAEKKNTKKSSSAKTTSTKKTNSTSKKTTNKNTTKKNNQTKSSTAKTVKTPVKEVVKEEIKKVETVETESKFVKTIKENIVLICLCFICVLLIINIVLIVKGHKVKLSEGKEIIGSIDGKDVTADELFDSLKEIYGTNKLIEVIDNEIISRETTEDEEITKNAKEQIESIKKSYTEYGYNWEEVLSNYGYQNEEALLKEIVNNLLKEKMVKNYITTNLTDDEIKKYYDENIENTYTAKHILIKPNTTDKMSDEEVQNAENAALSTANEVIEKLNNGENWKDLVNTYSQDTGSKEDEGLIENFSSKDVVKEFYEATKNLTDGSYTTSPVKSSFGYHIIYRVSMKEKDALETMKQDLIDEIVANKIADSNTVNNILIKIREKYNFKINDTVIEKKYNSTKSEQ